MVCIDPISWWRRLRSGKAPVRLGERGIMGGEHADHARAVGRPSAESQRRLPGWVGGFGASPDDSNVQLRLTPPTLNDVLIPSCTVRDVSTGKKYHAGTVTITEPDGEAVGAQEHMASGDAVREYGALFPSDFPELGHVRSAVFEVRWSRHGVPGPILLADPYLFELWNGELVAWRPE